MDTILVAIKDIIIGVLTTSILGIIISLVKKGQFTNWGKGAGRWLSKFGRARIGATIWEKWEDVLTISLVTFVQGMKEGADEDDAIVAKIAKLKEEEKNKSDKK